MEDLASHGIVAIVRDERGRFLMVEDGREPRRGQWAPPHGRCEAADGTGEASVIREVKEETGLDVVPVRKLWTQAADSKVKTVAFWTVKTKPGEVHLNDESSNFGWFTLDEALGQTLYEGTRKFLGKVKAGEISLA